MSEVLKNIKLRFTSGNEVPVTRAQITDIEFEQVLQHIATLERRLEEAKEPEWWR